MKSILKLVLLAGPLLALPTEAFAWGSGESPGCSSCGWHLCSLNPFNVRGCLAGPWYSYWPYEAHFTAAAPVACNYPFWPGAGGMSAFPSPAGGTVDFGSHAGSMGDFGSHAGGMADFGSHAGSMGDYGSYAGGMGYPGGAGFSYSQPPSWPAGGAYGNGSPVMGSPMQGPGFLPGQ